MAVDRFSDTDPACRTKIANCTSFRTGICRSSGNRLRTPLRFSLGTPHIAWRCPPAACRIPADGYGPGPSLPRSASRQTGLSVKLCRAKSFMTASDLLIDQRFSVLNDKNQVIGSAGKRCDSHGYISWLPPFLERY